MRGLRRRHGRAMTATVAKAVKRFNVSDKAAHEAVGVYVRRYMANRGLVASFPRLAYGSMREIGGWPVFNADESAGSIARFTTADNAHTSVVAWEQIARDR